MIRLFKQRIFAFLLIGCMAAGIVALTVPVLKSERKYLGKSARQWFAEEILAIRPSSQFKQAIGHLGPEFIDVSVKALSVSDSKWIREYQLGVRSLPAWVATNLPSRPKDWQRYEMADTVIQVLLEQDTEALEKLNARRREFELLVTNQNLRVSQTAAMALFHLETNDRAAWGRGSDHLEDSRYFVKFVAALQCLRSRFHPNVSNDTTQRSVSILNEANTNVADMNSLFGPAADGWRQMAQILLNSTPTNRFWRESDQ